MPTAPSVPFVTAWSGESLDTTPIITRPRGGIAYPDETPYDRDVDGVLWTRRALRQGRGRPLLKEKQVHPQRQRLCMSTLACQVCRGRADETEQGVLWLLDQGRISRRLRRVEQTTQPPICLPCAGKAIAHCPALKRGFLLLRVKEPTIDGVHGRLYKPGVPAPVLHKEDLVSYIDPRTGGRNPALPWVLAGQLYATLRNPMPVASAELSLAV